MPLCAPNQACPLFEVEPSRSLKAWTSRSIACACSLLQKDCAAPSEPHSRAVPAPADTDLMPRDTHARTHTHTHTHTHACTHTRTHDQAARHDFMEAGIRRHSSAQLSTQALNDSAQCRPRAPRGCQGSSSVSAGAPPSLMHPAACSPSCIRLLPIPRSGVRYAYSDGIGDDSA